MGTIKARRRRGPALEAAILEAAWGELVERGYEHFTLEAVAMRAGTSRPVLYRRWPGRADLAKAAMKHFLTEHPLSAPDRGSLREDLAALLRQLSVTRAPIATTMMLNMGGYFAETKSSFADLRSEFANRGPIDDILQRGIDRGEIDPRKLTPRIASLPIDLVRHEMMMTMEPVSDSVIAQILDEIFLPLVSRPSDRRPDPESQP